MGMNALKRRRFGHATVTPEGMDRETLIIEAIHRAPELEDTIPVDWQPDDETCRRVGWLLAKYTGTTFRIGRRLLQLSAPGGYLLPPVEYRMCIETEPSEQEMFTAPMLQPWSVTLWQSGDRPAEWQVSGLVFHPLMSREPRTWRLLYLHRDKRMARTPDGWVTLGRRMHS
jgi:hypothetical protein